MSYFNIVAETNENTVVTQYEPVKKHSDVYQSEAELEAEFIRMLTEQGYEYINAHSEDDMIANLRKKLEELNDYVFSDSEWERFFKECIANKNDRPEDKTRKIQEDSVQVLKRDDNMTKNITLIDRKNIHNNRLQIINQYVVTTDQGARHDNRYDVTVLVNGFPMVHIELKRRGVAIREAFNQITRYERDSFSAGYGLFEYVQIYVISNGTNTKYYSNSTRYNAIKDAEAAKTKKRKTSNSFEFTSFWADANNRVIPDLIDFTKTFFAKNTILNILTKYCIFTSENMLMVMRPYQITATERILNRIEIAHNYHKQGDIAAGGYIWHTTGSGKTLTSFKTARLASSLPYIDNHIANYMREKSILFLANTNPAVENLRRKVTAIDAQKCEFMTIKKFLMSRYNRTDYDILVMDECSMVSNSDMADIIDKISCEIMILVGDTYQIESITFGNWFSMAKYFVPAYAWNELEKPYRTKDEHLLEFWRKVRNLDDDLTEYIVNHRYSTSLDSSVFDKKSADEIILCLNYDGLYGINNINRFLQENNKSKAYRWGLWTFKVGDPILFNESERFICK